METKVLIGVDPHKATNALAVLDEHGELLGRTEFPADRKGLEALERWAANFPRRKWAVEGANGLGRTLAHRLASAGENVVDVPPKLSARVRVLSIGHGRKNDEQLDATFAALAAWRNGRLQATRHGEQVALNGYLQTCGDFKDHAQVMDAASAALQQIFPETPLPVRTTVGVASLPRGGVVEVSMVLETRD